MQQTACPDGALIPDELSGATRQQTSSAAAVRPHLYASRVEERLAWHSRIVEAIKSVSEQTAACSDPLEPLALLLDEMSRLVGNHAAAVFRFEPQVGLLRFICGHVDGRTGTELPGHPFGRSDLPVPVDIFPAWQDLIATGKPQFMTMTPEATAPPSNEWHVRHRHRALIQSALMVRGQPLGLLGLAFQSDVEPDSAQLEAYDVLARQFTLVLQQADLADRVRLAAAEQARQQGELESASRSAAELQRANTALTVRGDLLSVIAEATRQILQAPDLVAGIHDLLRCLGEKTQLSRVLFFQERPAADGGLEHFIVTEWCAPGIADHRSLGIEVIPNSVAKPFLDRMQKERAGGFWLDMAQAEEPMRSALVPLRILSTGCAPVTVDGLYAGVIAFDDCVRLRTEESAHVDAFLAVANVIGSALQRERGQQAIARERERAAATHPRELERTSLALQRTIDALQGVDEVEQVVPRVLAIVADTFCSEVCAVYENEPSGLVRLRYWHVDGQTLTPAQLLGSRRWSAASSEVVHTLAKGFPVPDSYLGTAAPSAVDAFVIDHRRGSSMPAFDRFALEAGWELELNIGVGMHGVRRATLCIFRGSEHPFSPAEQALGESLAKQMALAVLMAQSAKEAREAALVLEREQAAQARAAELERSSVALQQTIDAVAELDSLNDFVPRALRIVAEAFGADSAAFWEHPGPTIYLRFWFLHGTIYGPQELPGLDTDRYAVMLRLADGFTVPHDHLAADLHQRASPSIVNHATATASPKLHDFAMSMGWEWELNVPLVIGARAEGAITLYRPAGRPFSEAEFPLAEGLAKQMALAMKINQAAGRERELALSQERELAERLRTTELVAVNQALRRSLSRLAEIPDVEAALEEALLTVVEACGADGGAVGRYLPEERGFRNLFQIIGGDFVQAAGLSYGERLYSLDEPAMALAWEAFERSDAVLCCAPGSPYLTDDTLAYMRERGLSAAVVAPLKRGSEITGYLGLFSRRADQLSPGQQELVRALSDQIALMLELKQLSDAETQTAVLRDREAMALARAAELGQSNESLRRSLRTISEGPVDQAPVLMLMEVARAASAQLCYWLEFNAERRTLEVKIRICDGRLQATVPDDDPETFRAPFDVDITPAFHHLCASDSFIKLSTHFTSPMMWPGTNEWHQRAGRTESLAFVVRAGDQPLGLMGMGFTDRVRLTEVQEQLVRSLSNQFALALQMSRLAKAAEQAAVERARAAELESANVTMQRAVDRLAVEADLQSFLGYLLQEIASQLGSDTAAITPFDESDDSFHAGLVLADEQIVPLGAMPAALRRSEARFLDREENSDGFALFDVATDAALLWPGAADYLRSRGKRYTLSMLIRVEGRLCGRVNLAYAERPVLRPQQAALARALATQAAMAIQLTRLSQARSKSETAHAVAMERLRIAAEMHDSLAQSFTSIALQSESLRSRTPEPSPAAHTLGLIVQTARQGLAEVRASVLTLHSLDGPPGTLDKALAQLTARCSVPGSIQCSFVSAGEPCEIAGEARESLMRIAREALNNAMRHSGGTQIRVSLTYSGGRVLLRLEDDGKGLPAADPSAPSGYGLKGMLQRAREIGAHLEFAVSELGGAMVSVDIPCQVTGTAGGER